MGRAPTDHGAHIQVVPLDHNKGAVVRNVGVRHARTPYVAFADDDSRWQPGALTAAARIFDSRTVPAHVERARRKLDATTGPQPAASVEVRRPWSSAGDGDPPR